MDNTPSRPILYFDGVCNLCDATVQTIIRHDKQKLFLFAPLQSAAGAEAMKNVAGANKKSGSVILYYNGRYYTRSAAVLQTCKLLGGWFNFLLIGYLIPAFIRDALYNYIAKNRLQWYGQKSECMIPTPELRSRFLE